MGNTGLWNICNDTSDAYATDDDACCAFGQQSPSHEQKQTDFKDAHSKAIARPAPAYTSIVPGSSVISDCKAAVAQSATPLELQLVLQSFSHSIREQGWTVLIAECGKRGEPEKAQQVFDAVPNKNVWHYSSLITAFGACGQWRAALQLLERLKQLSRSAMHLQPNHVTYSAAIVACAKAGRVDHVQRIFQEMMTAGEAVSHSAFKCTVQMMPSCCQDLSQIR
jgi:pentatricopeptide repeat protein